MNATGKHAHLLGAPKRTKAQIQARKQQLQNYRAYMDARAQYVASYDSAKVVYLDSIYTGRNYSLAFKTDSLWSGLPDTLRYDYQKTPDSVIVSQKVLAAGNFPPEAVRYLSNPPRKPSVNQLKASTEDYKAYTGYKSKYAEAYDTAKVEYLDSIYLARNMNLVYRTDKQWSTLPENSRYPYAQEDSLIVSKKVLDKGDFPPEARHYLSNPPPNPKELILDRMDSTAYSPEQLEALAQLQAGDMPVAGGVPDAQAAFGGQQNPNMLDVSSIMGKLNTIDAEAFGKQQAKDKAMKKKYSELPDQRKPEEGTKRNSLENASVASRIYFGGNLSITSTDPLIIDFGLQLGYWIRKKWLAGVGGSVREQFGGPATLVTGDSWGHSFFTRYDLPKGFFAYSEYERKKTESLFEREQAVSAQWQEAFLSGLGKEFKAGPVRSQMMLLYDFTWRTNDLYAQPIVFKIGFQVSRKP